MLIQNARRNLYILPGDVDLDICSRNISHWLIPSKEAWKKKPIFAGESISIF